MLSSVISIHISETCLYNLMSESAFSLQEGIVHGDLFCLYIYHSFAASLEESSLNTMPKTKAPAVVLPQARPAVAQ